MKENAFILIRVRFVMGGIFSFESQVEKLCT